MDQGNWLVYTIPAKPEKITYEIRDGYGALWAITYDAPTAHLIANAINLQHQDAPCGHDSVRLRLWCSKCGIWRATRS